MQTFSNRTFDEIQVGETLTLSRQLSEIDVEALSLVSGDVDPLHIDGAESRENGNGNGHTQGRSAKSVGSEALLSGMLCRRLPGPGTTILEQHLRFSGGFSVSDELVGTVTAREKRAKDHAIVFDCQVSCQGRELVAGTVTVAAPTNHATYSSLATPEILIRRNDQFARLLQRCEGLAPVVCAIVHPCDRAH